MSVIGLVMIGIGAVAAGIGIAALGHVLSEANDVFEEQCPDLRDEWAEMCSNTIQTAELGMEVIETTSDMKPLAGQTKQKP